MEKSKNIVVFGSYVTDLTARAKKMPAAGETVKGSSFYMGPGGKGSNQAVAAFRAGADVRLITKVGDDVFGREALNFYHKEGMDTSGIVIDDRYETGCALIIVNEQTAQNEIVVVSGACGHITPEDIERNRAAIAEAEILLLQMEINQDALLEAIRIGCEAGACIVLNPAPAIKLPDEVLRQIDIITPNETEAEILTGLHIRTAEDAGKAAEALMKKGVGSVVITLGADGVFAMNRERSEWIPRIPVEAIDTTGAGDAFNGGFVTALAEGRDLFAALRYGNVTGALAVTKMGTAPAMPARTEIDQLYHRLYS